MAVSLPVLHEYSGDTLTLKVPITTAADDIYKYVLIVLFIYFFAEKIRLDIGVNPLLGRGFTCKIKPYFLRNIKAEN